MTLLEPPPPQSATLDALYRRFHVPILTHVRRFVTDHERAQELTQDTFLKAWLAMQADRYAEEGNVSGWLYRIATNVCVDYLRHEKLVKWQEWDVFMKSIAHVPKHRAACGQRFSTEDHATRYALNREAWEEVRKALLTLPERYRQVWVLCEVHDLSYDEIGEVMGMTRPGVKSMLFRTRNQLAAALGVQRVMHSGGRWARVGARA